MGLLVTFEGIDGAGKTTQAELLGEALGDAGVAVREPGGTLAGERLRELLRDPAVELGVEAEALLFAAARAELVARVIRPALVEGRVVICDRYVDSSLAYQGEGRGLGTEAVAEVNRWATGGLWPDLTFLLSLEPGEAAARQRAGDRAGGGFSPSHRSDRFEGEGASLQERVAEAYERLAEAEPWRWRRIAAGRPAQQIHADVLEAVEALRAKAPA
jgi:dTMP kinase